MVLTQATSTKTAQKRSGAEIATSNTDVLRQIRQIAESALDERKFAAFRDYRTALAAVLALAQNAVGEGER